MAEIRDGTFAEYQVHFAMPGPVEPPSSADCRPAIVDGPQGQSGDDAAVVANLCSNPALAALYRGDCSAFGGDESNADFAFLKEVGSRTGWNDEQTERIWLGSPLAQRGKTRNRADYRASTIRRAFESGQSIANFDGMTANGSRWLPGVGVVQTPPVNSWPDPLAIGPDEWLMSRSTPNAIIENLIYADVGTIIAAGGTGKTTFGLWLLIHVVLGIDFCGRKVVTPGRVVLLTAEDSREILIARLHKIAAAMFPHGTRTPDDREAIMSAIRHGIIIIDVTANVVRLTCIERDTVKADAGAVDALAATLAPLCPSLLLIDPTVSFGVGEGRVNDAEQALIEAARRLRAKLPCAVFFVHHTGKANAREQTEDQYSGRGGSALSDGSRMVFVINRPKPNDWTKQTGETLAPGETGLKISLAKLSYCEPQKELYVVRHGYEFRHLRAATQTDEERDRADETTVLRFLSDELANGIPHSQKTLGDVRERVGLSRDRLRSIVHRLLETAQLAERREPGKSNALIPATLAGSIGEGA
jgi:regulatory protein RepA